jgi:sugar O-acyltransferase (sialic acid O-acetyltransferase NeuD family)
MKPLWIVGAGGHAKVVIETARTMGAFEPVGILDDDPCRLGSDVLGVPVRGAAGPESVAALGVGYAVVAIGDNRARAEVARRLDGRVEWATLVHPASTIALPVRLGEGTVVFAGAIVQPDAEIGRHVIVNTGASVDHDSIVGDFAHLAPGVRLAGNVRVGEGAFLGIASCVVPARSVGAWATVGAGGVVTVDVPEAVVAVGVPARWTVVATPANGTRSGS